MQAKSWFAWLALVVVALLAGWQVWSRFSPGSPPVGVHVPATPAPAVAALPTLATPIKSGSVRTYTPAAKARLKLPDSVQAAPQQQVIAASTVKPDSHAYTLTTLVDTDTGEVTTLQRREPLPWLARDPSGHVDLLLGYRDGGPVARLSLTQNLLQVKAWRLGVGGSITQSLGGRPDTEWLVGINLGINW